MTRALCFLALLAAFVVVGARCLSVFVAQADESSHDVALSQASHAPADQDSATSLSVDDDSDEGVDALLAPSPSALGLPLMPCAASAKVSVLCQQRALQSHAQGLERPPRV